MDSSCGRRNITKAVQSTNDPHHAISLNHVIDWDQVKVIDRESKKSGQMDQGGDTYQEGARQVDEQRRRVLPTLPQLRHPVHPETEWRTAIRQTFRRRLQSKPKRQQ